MHPVARILCVLVLAAFLSSGDVQVLVAAALLLAFGYGVTDKASFRAIMRPLWRMRWLLLGVMIIYLWLPTGVTTGTSGQTSMQHGLILGVERASALALLIIAVNLLSKTTSREQLLAGIYWLAKPLGYLGIPRERLALRLALVLDLVPRVQERLAQYVVAAKFRDNPISAMSQSVSQLMCSVLNEAEEAPLDNIEIGDFSNPTWVQWMYPLGLAFVLGVIKFSV